MRVSPSQIKDAQRCPSRWYRKTVLGEKEPRKPWQDRGEYIHKLLEDYALAGKLPIDKYALSVIPLLSPPYRRDQVEWPFQTEHVTGRIDLRDTAEDGTWRATDWKTQATIKPMSHGALAEDPQALFYAVFDALDREGFDGLGRAYDVRWVYIQTGGRPKKEAVTYRYAPWEAWERFQGFSGVFNDLDLWRDVVPALVPSNLEACGDYGGCFFRAKCAELGRASYGQLSSVFTKRGKP